LFEQGTIGTKEEFIKAYGDKPLGRFVRSILGLDINAAKQAFGEILNNQTLNATQIRFINTLINYLSVNGVVEPAKLFDPPFTDVDTAGIAVFDEPTSMRIIQLIEWINRNAEVA
jgi:type I restriction enzyme R subunit